MVFDEDSLDAGEPHPMASAALSYVVTNLKYKPMLVEALASAALSGNRCAQICMGTYSRLQKADPVSDRYILGLAWMVKELVEGDPHGKYRLAYY